MTSLHTCSTNVEAVASLAADRFYSDQPEVALLLYRWVFHVPIVNSPTYIMRPRHNYCYKDT